MIEMEDQTNDINEAGIPVLDYKTYTDRVFFLPSKDGEKDVMITGKLDIPEARRQTVEQALYQFSNLLNSKSFLINVSTELDAPCLLARHTSVCVCVQDSRFARFASTTEQKINKNKLFSYGFDFTLTTEDMWHHSQRFLLDLTFLCQVM